jgi:hypothetical protein
MVGDASSWLPSVVHKRLTRGDAPSEVVTRRTQKVVAANI